MKYKYRGCSNLTTITIGKSVTKIGSFAFTECESLSTVTLLNPIPPTIDNTTFSSFSAALQVPAGSKTAYQNADYWRNFTNIVETDSSSVQSIPLDKSTNAPIYDLNGKKLREPSKGINIIGGKKVLLK